MDQLPNIICLASIWVIPVVIAITFHEAAHGFVARFLGDETAWRLGLPKRSPGNPFLSTTLHLPWAWPRDGRRETLEVKRSATLPDP